MHKVFVTLLIIALYHGGYYIAIPDLQLDNVNKIIIEIFDNKISGNIIACLSLVSGGTLSDISIFNFGVYPYIAAYALWIVIQHFFKKSSKENLSITPLPTLLCGSIILGANMLLHNNVDVIFLAIFSLFMLALLVVWDYIKHKSEKRLIILFATIMYTIVYMFLFRNYLQQPMAGYLLFPKESLLPIFSGLPINKVDLVITSVWIASSLITLGIVNFLDRFWQGKAVYLLIAADSLGCFFYSCYHIDGNSFNALEFIAFITSLTIYTFFVMTRIWKIKLPDGSCERLPIRGLGAWAILLTQSCWEVFVYFIFYIASFSLVWLQVLKFCFFARVIYWIHTSLDPLELKDKYEKRHFLYEKTALLLTGIIMLPYLFTYVVSNTSFSVVNIYNCYPVLIAIIWELSYSKQTQS